MPKHHRRPSLKASGPSRELYAAPGDLDASAFLSGGAALKPAEGDEEEQADASSIHWLLAVPHVASGLRQAMGHMQPTPILAGVARDRRQVARHIQGF